MESTPNIRNGHALKAYFQMLERLANIAEDVWKSEPGTTKYGIFIPRVDDGKTAWVVEE